MRFFLLWCAVVYSTRVQQVSSDPTPTSNGTSIPWVTYTSTGSCTSRPSTIFVYTSNSSSFFLTHYGPSSASTLTESTSTSTASDTQDAVASESSFIKASSRSFDGSPATPQEPFSVIAGSTCPLPSTVTISAPPSNSSCDSTAEKTVTSYVMTSCKAYDYSGISLSSARSEIAEQLATTRQRNDTESPTNTALAGDSSDATLVPIDSTLSKSDSANLCTSVTERTITIEHTIERTVSAPEPKPVYITFTTLQGGSTVYLNSLSERTSVTRPHLDSISTSYTRADNGSTSFPTYDLQATSDRDFVVYTTYREASTVLSTTIIRQTPSPITITSTGLLPGTTLYSLSTVVQTAIPITLTYTQLMGTGLIPRTSVIRQMPTTITITSTQVQDESTLFLTSVITSTPELLTSVYTETQGTSTIYSISVSESTPDALTITYTELQEASTRFVTSVIENTPEPLTSTLTITTPGNGTLSGDASEPTPDPGNEETGNPEEDDEGEPDDELPNEDFTSSEPSPTVSVEPVQSPTAVIADPTELAQQQNASSDPFVVAQVVNPEDNPPITPASNSSFLLVTFGSTAASPTASISSSVVLRKRQSSQQPLTYNATVLFNSVAGGIYNLSAAATMAQNGDTPLSCMLSICVEGMCGPSYSLRTTFDTFVYTYNSPSTVNNQAGIFSIRCLGQAYVGLDNVRVDPVFVPQPLPASSLPGASSSSGAGLSAAVSKPTDAPTRTSGSSATAASARASVRTVTTSILSTFTTTAYATQTLTRTESAQVVTITQVSTNPGKFCIHFTTNSGH